MRIWIVLSLLLIGCANKDNRCGNKVLTLWPSVQGDYSFQEIKLETLSSPYELSGRVAKIYYESGLGKSGLRGAVAQPRFTRSGDVCVPMDAQSSLAVNVYAQFEALHRFEEKLGTVGLLSWPRKVGIDIHLRSSDGTTHNNAHYISAGDSIAVIPYSLGALPLSANQGIIAHEHFHAHFNAAVVIPVNTSLTAAIDDFENLFYQGGSFKPTIDDVDHADISRPRGLNAFVLRAWNEGLADLYGAIYTHNPRFFDESLPTINGARSLNAPLIPFSNRIDLTNVARQAWKPGELVGVSYGQGALLARLMYRIAMSGVETPEEFLARMIHRLADISPAIVNTYDTQVLNFEDIVPILLKDFPLTPESCGFMRVVLSKELMVKGLAQCSGR